MYDALDIRTAPRCLAAAPAAARSRRPGVRRPLLRKALDDWDSSRCRVRMPA